MTKLTIAAKVAQIWNASRNKDLNAYAAFENVINASFGSVTHNVTNINIHHREVRYSDGSILTVLDQAAARAAGLTEFDYCFKSQDKLC